MRHSDNPMLLHVLTWRNASSKTKVDILVSRSPRIALLVLGFHSTIVQNLVTKDHVVVLYPHATFSRTALATSCIPLKIIQKYQARHIRFQFVVGATARIDCDPKCPCSHYPFLISRGIIVVPISGGSHRQTYAAL